MAVNEHTAHCKLMHVLQLSAALLGHCASVKTVYYGVMTA